MADPILPGTGRWQPKADGGGYPCGDSRAAHPHHRPSSGPHPRSGEDLFAATAAKLAGAAGMAFGWRPEEFWRATPTELGALVTVLAGEAAEPADAALLARLKEQFPDG